MTKEQTSTGSLTREEMEQKWEEIRQGYAEIRQDYVWMRKSIKWVVLAAIVLGCLSFFAGRYIGKQYLCPPTSVEGQSKCPQADRGL